MRKVIILIILATGFAVSCKKKKKEDPTPPTVTVQNVAPTVSITSPEDGDGISQGTNISISANAADSDGTISKVEFYVDNVLKGEDQTAPYSISSVSLYLGEHVLLAKAYDNKDGVAVSDSVHINIFPVVMIPSLNSSKIKSNE